MNLASLLARIRNISIISNIIEKDGVDTFPVNETDNWNQQKWKNNTSIPHNGPKKIDGKPDQ